MPNPETIILVNELLIENALLHARDILKTSFYRKYSPNLNAHRYDVYEWAKAGWGKMQQEGDFQLVVRQLQLQVPDGNLTAWWRQGRSKKEMIALFSAAIDSLPVLELA